MLRSPRRRAPYSRYVMGQEPTGGDPAVVVPPASPEVPAPVEPATPEAPVVTPPATPEPQMFDLAYVQGLRQENAGHRVKNKELQDALDAIKLAEMTELDRVKTLHQKAETEVIPALQSQVRNLQVENAAVKMNVVDPQLAATLIDWTKVEQGSTVEAELVALLEARPYLKGQAATATTPATPAPTTPATPTVPVSQTNPAVPSAHQGRKTYTQSQLMSMSVEQAQAEMTDITYALKNGLVDKTR